jgi:hypothetical protein
MAASTGGSPCRSRRLSCLARLQTAGFHHRATRWTSAAGWETKPRTCPGSAGALWASIFRRWPLPPPPGSIQDRGTCVRTCRACRCSRLPSTPSWTVAAFTILSLASGQAMQKNLAASCGRAASCCCVRPCAVGVPNDIDEEVVRAVFGHWHIQHMTRATVPSDTRTLELLVVRLTT